MGTVARLSISCVSVPVPGSSALSAAGRHGAPGPAAVLLPDPRARQGNRTELHLGHPNFLA